MMDQEEYLRVSDECLARVANWLEQLDPDEVDYSIGDGVVTLEFPDGGRFILSRQSATNQIWLAADAHAWHYNWDAVPHRWIDDRDGHLLDARLAEVVAEKVGHTIDTPILW